MNNVFVYCEIEQTTVQEVSQELLTKGRKLANQLGVELHAIVAGTDIKGKVEDQILPYGVDKLFVFDGKGLFHISPPYRHTRKPIQRGATTDCAHGRNRYRTRLGSSCVIIIDIGSDCRLYAT